MSDQEQEARALEDAREFLLDLSSGVIPRIPSNVRKEARDILRHYPLNPGSRWRAKK